MCFCSQLKSGQTVVLTTEDKYKNACDKSHIWVDYDNIINVALPRHTIFIDNDSIMLNVQDINGDAIKCVVEGDCKLGSSKTVHLPGIKVELPALTEADREDVEWGLEAGVDVIFASFVRNVECVKLIREVLGERGKNIKVVAKIENNEGISNFDDILKVVDGIMVGRRSLGAEIPLYKVSMTHRSYILYYMHLEPVEIEVHHITRLIIDVLNKPTPLIHLQMFTFSRGRI